MPTLLGPYQDIEATVVFNGDTIALSSGSYDTGLFVTDLVNDDRVLPFEGMDVTKVTLTLNIFYTDENGRQRDILKNLNDVIFHLNYVIK